MNNLTDSNLGLNFAGVLPWLRLSLSVVDRKIGRAMSGISEERETGGESSGRELLFLYQTPLVVHPLTKSLKQATTQLCLYDAQSSTSGRFLSL